MKQEQHKLYYSIGEVADKFGVNVSLIRFWEKEFDIIKPQKNKKGNRLFTNEDIDKFHLIYHLVKEQGMTLKGAANLLKIKREKVEAHFEIIKRLKRVKEELSIIKNHLP